ncbi:splicing factor 3B subunit 2-like [Physella acuta]|uniref:splicing factor 3B subunit 2-like n=1 Tax=Physella acuta TaxID=109671 RepID=UPI0027DB95A6|nr:splicing factor 3B subunit 2-like [Physella acuta]
MDPTGESGDGHMHQGGKQMMAQDGPGSQREDELAWKVAMQRQLLEQQERHMGLMEQQQLALLEAQRTEQQQRMMAGHPMGPTGMSAAAPMRGGAGSMISRGLGSNHPGMMQSSASSQMMGGGGPHSQQSMASSGGGSSGQMMQGQMAQGGQMMQGQMAQGGQMMQGQMAQGGQMMQGQMNNQMMQGPPHLMQMNHGGPQMMHGGPQMMHGHPQMSQSGMPPQMSQGGPHMMGQGGPNQMLMSELEEEGEEEEEDDPELDAKDAKSNTQPANLGPKEMRLPQALEKMLEFKSQRASELGVDLDSIDNKEADENNEKNEDDVEEEAEDEEKDGVIEEEYDDEIITKDQTKESKNKRKKKKKKKARRNRFEQQKKMKKKDKKSKAPDVIIEYVQEQLELDPTDPSYHTFARIFEAFKITEPEKPKEMKTEEKEEKKEEVPIKAKGLIEDDDDEEPGKIEEDGPKISKKKLKKLTRLTVAQLKQLVNRPDVVEMHDVTARDPRLLVHLKATRNSVPVPRHWCYKRKYLQGKRGIEKTPFELPDFIKATGIEEMRAALQEKEDQKTLKSKMREKVRPKMGKIDIDYQKLHDAFFRFQTKPKMTIHGDLYYEAKEFETKLREKKPGNLSDDLKMALGMPIGNNSEKVPPPWLIAMQRYGPPPSYPNLKIPGLNAPIPDGCMFGYHAGGWGKPPVDEHGKPLYGDVFGTQSLDFKNEVEEEEIDKTQWGELESESESEEESEEEEEEDKDESGLITPAEGLMTPGGITSVPLGMETPDQIELRKKRIEDAMDQGGDTPALYQVLPEKKTTVGGAMMGSAHVYDISAVQKKAGDKPSAEAVEVSLNPEELDLDTAAMQAKYEQTVREQQSQLEKEDLSDMVAAHAAKQRKRKKAQQDTSKGAKKYKDFKF